MLHFADFSLIFFGNFVHDCLSVLGGGVIGIQFIP